MGCCRRGGLGVGHFKYPRHASHDSCLTASFQVFLVFCTGLAKMHLAINNARENVEIAAIQGLREFDAGHIAYGNNTTIFHRHIAQTNTVVIDESATT